MNNQDNKHLIPGTSEWKAWRNKRVGASDAPIVMGVSPWKTPIQLWEEKLGLRQGYTSESMQRGIDMEEKARAFFEKMSGILVVPKVKEHPKFNWMAASLDGIDLDEKNIVEIKCPGHEDHEKARNGVLPEKYFPQLQHQLEVTGLEMAHYFSFNGTEGVILRIYRDDAYIQKMVAKEYQFFECLESWTPPELTERDYKEKQDILWAKASQDYLKAKEGREHFEKKENIYRELLIGMCEGSNSRGSGVSVCKIARKGNVDYSKIPELENVDLDKYRKDPVVSWRISSV